MISTHITSRQTDDDYVAEIRERMTGARQAVVTVIGELDHCTCGLLQSALLRTWRACPVVVLVDLRQVTFINAGGLRTLLLASRTARIRGVPLVLQAGPGQVARLLTLVGLGDRIASPAEVCARGYRGAGPDDVAGRLIGIRRA